MTLPFLTGLIGSLILVTGAAWPEKPSKKHPVTSIRNWLFTIGSSTMLVYSILGYINGGLIFFVFLQGMIGIASLLMMVDASSKIEVPIISTTTVILIIWSLYLLDTLHTTLFILGATGIALGYTFGMGTFRRNIALTIGSIFLVIFSYIEQSWIFFWLNIFFAIFSSYYAVKSFKD
ncbi:hypothetical protein HN709_04375 [Candidatus Peregrinibacteria bacterium]|jgi:hypothetical protein|nr:hypothetical protein [Candidatus Peregrinibacteria bacterium]MBT7736900.1 hypothetical protein [Candidatus Peregrinibacteria bacterium]